MAAPCNVTLSSGIMTLNSSGGSTLQCSSWLWGNMPLNSPKRPPYWNSTSGFDFENILQSSCHSVGLPVCEILSKSDHPRQKIMGALKMTDMTELQGMKLQDMKMADQIAGHENARHEIDGPSCRARNCRVVCPTKIRKV